MSGGKSPSIETRNKISKSLKSKPVNWNVIKSMSEARKGKPSPTRVSIVAHTVHGVYVGEFTSMSSAAKILMVSVSAICNICKGKLKNTKGYIFTYLS